MSDQAIVQPTVFDTPDPVRLHLAVPAGRVEISTDATSRTTVQVSPMNHASDADREAADQTRISRNGTDIHVEVPEQPRAPLGRGAIRVSISMPAESGLSGTIAAADLTVSGVLGDGMLKSASGEVRLETVGAFYVKGASGDVHLNHVTGDLEVNTASGEIRVGEADAGIRIGTASGDVRVGTVRGDLRADAKSGDIRVQSMHGSATCGTASGDIEIGRISDGTVEARTASGDVTIGVPAGTAAWLQAQSVSGDVESRLDPADAPAEGEARAQIFARSVSGDIIVRRAEG